MNEKGKSIHVADGVRLYKQSRSKFWWAAIRIDGQEQRASTKSTDQKVATLAALELYAEAKFKVRHGLPLKSIPSFESIAIELIDQLRSTHYGKENDKALITVLNNYLIPYFKNRAIDKVDRPAIHEFYKWREEYTGKEISPTQRSNTNNALRRVLNLACDKGVIKQADIPQLPTPSISKKKSRDYFNIEECTKVFSLKNLNGFIDSSRNHKTRAYRSIFKFYIGFLFRSGLRPGEEAVQLKFGDISFVNHKGKTRCIAKVSKGKSTRYSDGRDIFLDKYAHGAIRHVIKLSTRYKAYDDKLEDLIKKNPKDFIFRVYFDNDDQNGVTPPFEKSMSQYMKFIGLNDKNHVLYSFRHSYITYQLLRDVSAYDIAKQCGTSEAMIERYYDHVAPLQRADKLELPSTHSGSTIDEWLIGNTKTTN